MVKEVRLGSSPKPLERVVIFIDGGYIRELFRELFEHDRIDFTNVARSLIRLYNTWPPNPHRAPPHRSAHGSWPGSRRSPARGRRRR